MFKEQIMSQIREQFMSFSNVDKETFQKKVLEKHFFFWKKNQLNSPLKLLFNAVLHFTFFL